MHETLPIISAARRLEARKTKRRQKRPAGGSVTPIGAGRAPTLAEFEPTCTPCASRSSPSPTPRVPSVPHE